MEPGLTVPTVADDVEPVAWDGIIDEESVDAGWMWLAITDSDQPVGEEPQDLEDALKFDEPLEESL